MIRILIIVASLLATSASSAFEPDEVLQDSQQEARARAITQELRCLVCQNESIDASNAPLARDLRVIVRERIKAGDTDEQVVEYVVARYGRFVLLRPPVEPATYVVWFGPFLLLIIGLTAAFFYARRGTREAAAVETSLSAEEQRRLQELTKEE
jgi:cytochrome c-type biogenesis protein CcmH